MNRFVAWLLRRKMRREVRQFLERLLGRSLTRKEKDMLGMLFTNWKTTLFGLIAAAIQFHAGGMTWKAALAAAATAALGLVAKDHDVSGGAKLTP